MSLYQVFVAGLFSGLKMIGVDGVTQKGLEYLNGRVLFYFLIDVSLNFQPCFF